MDRSQSFICKRCNECVFSDQRRAIINFFTSISNNLRLSQLVEFHWSLTLRLPFLFVFEVKLCRLPKQRMNSPIEVGLTRYDVLGMLEAHLDIRYTWIEATYDNEPGVSVWIIVARHKIVDNVQPHCSVKSMAEHVQVQCSATRVDWFENHYHIKKLINNNKSCL